MLASRHAAACTTEVILAVGKPVTLLRPRMRAGWLRRHHYGCCHGGRCRTGQPSLVLLLVLGHV